MSPDAAEKAAKAHASMLRTIARPETQVGDALLAGADALERLAEVEGNVEQAEEVTAAYRSALLDLVDAAERVGRELPSHDDLVVNHALGELAEKAGEAAGTLEEELIGDELVQRMRRAEIERDQAKLEVERLQQQLDHLEDVPHHVIEFRADGWTLKHPLSCRPNLFDCPTNKAALVLDGPPGVIGQYVVDLDDFGELRVGEEMRADG